MVPLLEIKLIIVRKNARNYIKDPIIAYLH